MSKEWITDENCNSVERKEEQKLEREKEQACATLEFILSVVAEPVLVLTSLHSTLPLIIHCLKWATHCARCCGKRMPQNF